jgi:putative ABC transport system permease protein
MLDEIGQDLRYSLRLMRKSYFLTASVVLTLALGIGANSLVFSVVRAVILRPLDYSKPEQLVQLWESGKRLEGDWVSYPDFRDWAKQAQSFAGMAAYTYDGTIFSGDRDAEPVLAVEVTDRLFDVLGAKTIIGRTFLQGEDQPGRDPVVVISYALWQRRYSGDRGIAGRKVDVGGSPYTIAGVMPASFRFPNDLPAGGALVPIDAWIAGSRRPDLEQRGSHNFWTVARLKPGVSLQQAKAEMDGIGSQLASEFPDTNKNLGVSIAYLHDHFTGSARLPLLMLSGAVGLLLLLACSNIANLLLSRAESRRREMAVRQAIGAGRGRLIRQALTESILLSFFGAVAGLALVSISFASLLKWAPADIPRIQQASLDLSVVLFTAGVALVAGILFGLAPAIIAAGSNVHDALKRSGARSGSERANAFRHVLITGQVALAVILLIGAGLLMRSFINVTRLDPGFRPERMFIALFNLIGNRRYEEPAQRIAFFDEILRRVHAVPGVESVALSDSVPFSGINNQGGFGIEGLPDPLPGQDHPIANRPRVSTGYFETMEIPLIRGRLFNDHDRADSARVAIISDLAARTYWPNQNPIGKRLNLRWLDTGQPVWHEIVGVVRSTRHFGMEAGQKPEVYVPYTQMPDSLFMILAVRTRGDMESVIRACRTEIASIDPQEGGFPVEKTEELLLGSESSRRFESFLLASFAVLAVFLASVGIYGVAAYAVTQRGREIGIRLALGARPGAVVLMIAKQEMFTIGAGIVIGFFAAAVLAKALAGLLFDISPLDLATFASVLVLVISVGAASIFVPTRRASNVDPVVVLSEE